MARGNLLWALGAGSLVNAGNFQVKPGPCADYGCAEITDIGKCWDTAKLLSQDTTATPASHILNYGSGIECYQAPDGNPDRRAFHDRACAGVSSSKPRCSFKSGELEMGRLYTNWGTSTAGTCSTLYQCICSCATDSPTSLPTALPTKLPTRLPTKQPTARPTNQPTKRPTSYPTKQPTKRPTKLPTATTQSPTHRPTKQPTPPTNRPTSRPTPWKVVVPGWQERKGVCMGRQQWSTQHRFDSTCRKWCTDDGEGCEGYLLSRGNCYKTATVTYTSSTRPICAMPVKTFAPFLDCPAKLNYSGWCSVDQGEYFRLDCDLDGKQDHACQMKDGEFKTRLSSLGCPDTPASTDRSQCYPKFSLPPTPSPTNLPTARSASPTTKLPTMRPTPPTRGGGSEAPSTPQAPTTKSPTLPPFFPTVAPSSPPTYYQYPTQRPTEEGETRSPSVTRQPTWPTVQPRATCEGVQCSEGSRCQIVEVVVAGYREAECVSEGELNAATSSLSALSVWPATVLLAALAW